MTKRKAEGQRRWAESGKEVLGSKRRGTRYNGVQSTTYGIVDECTYRVFRGSEGAWVGGYGCAMAGWLGGCTSDRTGQAGSSPRPQAQTGAPGQTGRDSLMGDGHFEHGAWDGPSAQVGPPPPPRRESGCPLRWGDRRAFHRIARDARPGGGGGWSSGLPPWVGLVSGSGKTATANEMPSSRRLFSLYWIP